MTAMMGGKCVVKKRIIEIIIDEPVKSPLLATRPNGEVS